MAEPAGSGCVVLREGRLHMPSEVYERALPGCVALALVVRDGQWLLLPLLAGAGGLQIKIRNLRGDRVIESQEFFRQQGFEQGHAPCTFELRQAPAHGGFQLLARDASVPDPVRPRREPAIPETTPAATISLREITADTVRAICDLVAAPTGYVAPNAVSIAQAHFHPEAWLRAVYAGETPVGFVMLADSSLLSPPPAEPEVGLWRFMIDAGQQRRGYGRAALRLVIGDVRRRHPALEAFSTSCVPGPQTPRPFYESLGFVFTGEVDDGEEVLVLQL